MTRKSATGLRTVLNLVLLLRETVFGDKKRRPRGCHLGLMPLGGAISECVFGVQLGLQL